MTNPWLDQISTKHTVTKLLVIGWVVAVIAATHQWAFVINPKQYTDASMKYAMYAYWIGWLLLAFGTHVLAVRALWGYEPTWIQLAIIGAIRPLSILFIHYKLNSQTGNWYFGYLTSQPIFAITDVIIPGALLYFAWRERDNENLLSNSKVEIEEHEPVASI